MGQQEGNHAATRSGVEEELDPFEQLAAALQAWTPDVSGDKKTLSLKKWDINLQTGQLLELLIGWFEYRKSPEFAKCFEDKFRQFYTEVHEFYDKAAEGAFAEDELFNAQIPSLKASAERLALYIVRVKAMCEDDAGIAPDGFGSDEQDGPPYACINVKNRTITIGSATYEPRAPTIWTFLKEVVDNYEKGMPTDKEEWKNQWDMLGRNPTKKGIGKEGRNRLIRIVGGDYWRDDDVKVKR